MTENQRNGGGQPRWWMFTHAICKGMVSWSECSMLLPFVGLDDRLLWY